MSKRKAYLRTRCSITMSRRREDDDEDLDGSTQSLANDSETHSTASTNRKTKNTWSMLKWFDREKKPTKGESPGGLEEVLNSITSTDFADEQLPKLCGLNYGDFVELANMDRRGVVFWLSSGHRGRHSLNHSKHSSNSSNAATAPASEAAVEDKQLSPVVPPRLEEADEEEDEEEDDVAELVDFSDKPNAFSSASGNLTPAQKRAIRLKRTQSEAAPAATPANSANSNANNANLKAPTASTKKAPPPISPRRHEIEGTSPPKQITPPPPASASPAQAKPPPSFPKAAPPPPSSTAPTTTQVPDSFTEEVQRRIKAKRANLVHSMTFTAKDLDPTARFMTGREKTHSQESKRREALWDLFQSELYFLIDYLMVLKHVFMEPLKKVQVEGHIMMAEPEMLFGNLDELCCVNYAFCKDFLHWLLSSVGPDGEMPVTEVIGKLFEKEGKTRSLSQAYHRYSLNYINALTYLESLRKHQDFCEFEKWCYRDPRCKKLQLTDFLVSPVHHIMKIPLIVKHLEERTEKPEEKAVITKVLEMKEASLRELDDKMKWLKNFERLLEIQRNIVWPSVLDLDAKQYVPDFLKTALSRQPCERLIVSPRRQILLEGSLMCLDSGKAQEMYLILFDDLFIVTRRKKALSKKKSTLTADWGQNRGSASSSSSSSYHPHHGGLDHSTMKYVVHKQPLSLDRFFIHEVSPAEAKEAKLENAFVLICLNRFQQIVQVHTFQAETELVKREWLAKLREAQEIWRRTLQTTIFKGTVQCNAAAAAAGGGGSAQSSPTVGE